MNIQSIIAHLLFWTVFVVYVLYVVSNIKNYPEDLLKNNISDENGYTSASRKGKEKKSKNITNKETMIYRATNKEKIPHSVTGKIITYSVTNKENITHSGANNAIIKLKENTENQDNFTNIPNNIENKTQKISNPATSVTEKLQNTPGHVAIQEENKFQTFSETLDSDEEHSFQNNSGVTASEKEKKSEKIVEIIVSDEGNKRLNTSGTADSSEGDKFQNTPEIANLNENKKLQNAMGSATLNEKNENTRKVAQLKPNNQKVHNYSQAKRRSRGPGKKKRLPKAIVIGVMKSGTGALKNFLSINGRIKCTFKEVWYFNRDVNYEKGLKWYRKQMPFSTKNQITIEKTPLYFLNKNAPRRIQQMNPKIRLILVVREPARRAISAWLHLHVNQNSGKEDTLETFYFYDNHTIKEENGQIKASLYAQNLKLWLRYFPLKQIHIVDGNALVTDPASEVSKVETFLGLKPVVTRKNFYWSNNKGFFCFIKFRTKRCLPKGKGRKHPPVQPWILEKLKQYFHPYNLAFYKLINRTFLWD